MESRTGPKRRVWYKKLQQCSLCGATLMQLNGKCSNCGSINVVDRKQFQDDGSDEVNSVKEKFINKEIWHLFIIPVLYIGLSAFSLWRIPNVLTIASFLTVLSYVLAGIIEGYIIYDDAKKCGIGIREDLYGVKWPAPHYWLLSSLVLFPVLLPLYVYAKSRYVDEDYRLPALVLGILLVCVVGINIRYLASTPESKLDPVEKARIEKEEERLSNPALFFSNEK